jgi:hypothetical protein
VAIIRALKEINYQGALTMEPSPSISDAFMAISMEGFLPLRDVYAEECITRLRQCERGLSASACSNVYLLSSSCLETSRPGSHARRPAALRLRPSTSLGFPDRNYLA